MNESWQSLAAATIVGFTLLGFLWRFATRDRKSCGGGCDCPLAGSKTRGPGNPPADGQAKPAQKHPGGL